MEIRKQSFHGTAAEQRAHSGVAAKPTALLRDGYLGGGEGLGAVGGGASVEQGEEPSNYCRCPSCGQPLPKSGAGPLTEKEFEVAVQAKKALKMTGHMWVILRLLCYRVLATHEKMIDELYEDPDRMPDYAWATIKVFMVRIRNVLASEGIAIETEWGRGYYMTKENQTKTLELVKKLMEA